jgi:rare lipoprotein A
MNTKLTISSILLLVSTVFPQFIQAQTSSNKIGDSVIGMASYYPNDEDKRKTFSGDIYEMTAMEAAHKTFPMGSLIKVTNLETGKEVMLRVNDKPNTSERIMDMTLAAADSLGMVKDDKAVIPVKTEIVALGLPRSNNLRQFVATAPSPTKKQDEKVADKTIDKEAAKNAEKIAKEKVKREQVAAIVKAKQDKIAKDKADKIAKDKAIKDAAKVKADKTAKDKADLAAKDKAAKDKTAKDKIANPAAKIAPAAAKTETKVESKIEPKTETKVAVKTENITVLFKDIAIYDISGKKQKPQGFGVQTGNFAEENRAISEAKTIEAMKIGTVYIQTTANAAGKKTYAVLVGTFKAKEETKEIVKQLAEKKYSPFAKKY